MPILFASHRVRPLSDLLTEWRYFGIKAAPKLVATANSIR